MLRGMDVKDIVRRLRKVVNKTEFAKACGVSRATLYRIIDGLDSNPTLHTLQKIEAQLAREPA
jgi:DNA-binding phage protein